MRLWQPLSLIVVAAMMLPAEFAPADESPSQTAGQAAAPSAEIEIAAARKAIERFMSAVNQADPQALRDAIFCDFKVTAQKQGLIAVVDCIAFQRALERVMEARWGEKAIAEMKSRTRFSPEDQAAVKQARVERRGSADLLVILPAPQTPIQVRECNDGKYRVVLRIMQLYDSPAMDRANDRIPQHLPEPGSQKRIEYIRGVGVILQRNAQAVEEGKFQTFEQANAALEKTLEHVSADPPAHEEAQDGPEEDAP